MSSAAPLVAIVGRPNVGKSTLYNRLVGGRPALVEDVPGVTRDRRYGEAEFAGRRFRIVDTGGLDPSAPASALMAGVHRQAAHAIREADVIVFVTDVRDGLTTTDREVADLLRRAEQPVLVAANKVDSANQEALVGEIHELGLGEVYPISATHGRGAGDLLDAILALLPAPEGEAETESETESESATAADRPVRIAFV